jgi:hypothetical protein
MIFNFVILGNPEDPKGNPVPYKRTTQASKWSPEYQKYVMWKAHVQKAFAKKRLVSERQADNLNFLKHGKPLDFGKKKINVTVMISFVNDHHGDPDNVLKGINDALFVNDKYVACSVDFIRATDGQGMVAVTIEV